MWSVTQALVRVGEYLDTGGEYSAFGEQSVCM